MTLYGYWRSTTAYRVRIALNLKALRYETVAVDLTNGDQSADDYLSLNPIGGVPTLILDDGTPLTQSMAILEYLDRTYAKPPLLPDDPVDAAKVRAAAMVIASDIHPVNNLKVVNRLKALGHSQDAVIEWMNGWMRTGLEAYERLLPKGTAFSFSDTPTLADLCLIPQLYNASRWGADMGGLERLRTIEKRCLDLPAFADARPEAQPDAV